jgi:hypothetical protein
MILSYDTPCVTSYTHERPHEAIGMIVPAERYIRSQKEMPSQIAKIEYDEGAILRKVRGNGYISYKCKEYLVGEAFKEHAIEVRHSEIERSVDLYFGAFKIYTYDI